MHNYVKHAVDTENNIVVTKWINNKIVHVTSNYKEPLHVK